MSENLSHIKPGDKLYTKNNERPWGGVRRIPYICYVVDRLTAKQIVAKVFGTGREARFWIADGIQVGGSSFNRAFEPTKEQVAEQVLAVKVRNAQHFVKDKIRDMERCDPGQNDSQDDFWLMLSNAISAFEQK